MSRGEAVRLPAARRAYRGVLAPGDSVRWQGEPYVVTALSGSSVHLAPGPGSAAEPAVVLLSLLVAASDFTVVDGGRALPEAKPLPDWSMLEAISGGAAVEAQLWERHVVEVDTGLLPDAVEGIPPREGYDPARFTLIERYQRKAAELNAVLALGVSWQTVQRKRLRYLEDGIWGLVDKRRARTPSLHGRTDARVVALLLEMLDERQDRPDITARKLFGDLRRAARYRLGPQVRVPAEPTLYKLLVRLGFDARRLSDPTRRRRDRTNRPPAPFGTTTATAPGELVQIDSTSLDVKVLGDDGLPALVELTAAVDVHTRSIIAAVLRPKTVRGKRKVRQQRHRSLLAGGRSAGRATKAVDASLLLAQAVVPAPMRPGFAPEASAEFSDLPYEQLVEVDERMAHAAARPVIIPEMIVIDHGAVFATQTFRDACTYMGISLRPARKRTPTDKAIVERTFNSIKSLFSQHLNSYTGRDAARRGSRPVETDRLWTLQELDDLLQQWIALGWQNRPHEELRSPYDPNLPPLSPNQMYAAGVQAAGHLPIPLGQDAYLKLLPTAWVGVSDEGIRFKNRTYENYEGGLEAVRNQPSGLRGKKRGGWELRYNPYAPERVWLRDHRSGAFIPAVFKHQHLIGAPWTQYLWDIAAAEHVERGGRWKDEVAIAQALADLLERAGHGPDEPGAVLVPDGYTPHLPDPAPARFDPYADADPVDLATLGALPTLDIDDPTLYTPPPAPGDTAEAADAPETASGYGDAAAVSGGWAEPLPLDAIGDLTDALPADFHTTLGTRPQPDTGAPLAGEPDETGPASAEA